MRSSTRMDEHAPGATAIDPPLLRIAPGTRIRRHRRVTALSGVLLFACLFLPAVDACGPVIPYELPPVAPPYVFGLVFALIAISQTPRALRRGIAALRVVSVLVAVAGLVVMAILPEVGIPELGFGVALLAIIGLSRTSEARIAGAAIAVAAVSMPWFALWCLDDSALCGAYLSLAGSAGLFVGGVLWLRELAERPGVAAPP